MTRSVAASLLLLFLANVPAVAGDPAAGELVFKRNCMVCHAIGPGAANKTGPELNGVIGRKAGSAPGYNYSDANKNSGITWDEVTFTKYISNPKGVVPGTKMTFTGLKNDADIANLIAYLKQFGLDGQPVK
jgi:cytochrome c